MARPLAAFRHSHVTREEKSRMAWTKPMLVLALQEMPTLRPPRLHRQDKQDLQRIVVGALWHGSDDLRARMQQALANARAALNR